MKKHAWTGSSAGFTRALKQVEQCYQQELHTELDEVLKPQEEVILQLRNAEKLAVSTNSRVTKQLDRFDLRSLANDLSKLETELSLVETSVSECLAAIKEIDAQMPPREQLLALKNEEHYPNIYRACLE